jgi:ATP-dependent protease HslVU (ClpYQ) ATPase subunit
VLEKLAHQAMVHFGEDMPTEEIINCVSHGIVFVDEIDKIRSHVGG